MGAAGLDAKRAKNLVMKEGKTKGAVYTAELGVHTCACACVRAHGYSCGAQVTQPSS